MQLHNSFRHNHHGKRVVKSEAGVRSGARTAFHNQDGAPEGPVTDPGHAPGVDRRGAEPAHLKHGWKVEPVPPQVGGGYSGFAQKKTE